MMNKELIRKNFSRCAPYYDKYSAVQRLCASRLITGLNGKRPAHILEVGCGTGNYTALLRKRFPRAGISALDISAEMVKKAREKLTDKTIEFITADGEKMDFQRKFDLISSNAAFQWFEDLETALSRYKKSLHPAGIISFSTFGPQTFHRLNYCLGQFFGEKEAKINSCAFPEKIKLKRMLKRFFGKVEVGEAQYKEAYNKLSELLARIKYTGARGNGAGTGVNRKKIWTPKMINELEGIYKRKFGNIAVTYQAFFCRGEK
jgi:malonyl-CoA O-methyltransferase